VNEVNGGDKVFVEVYVSVRVCAADRSIMSAQKFFEKVAWPGSRDPLNLWALSANSSRTVKATDFKFDRGSPNMTP